MTKVSNKLMTKRSAILCLLTLLGCIKLSAQQQRFFNLTVEDVKIDSVLPHFHYAIPVGEQYADSVYELEIRYPEFMDMSKTDIERYNALTAVIPPSLPEIHRQMTVERKKGVLEISLMPIVQRNGRKQFLVSFMIALTSGPERRPPKGEKTLPPVQVSCSQLPLPAAMRSTPSLPVASGQRYAFRPVGCTS